MYQYILSYLLGSINFSLLISKILKTNIEEFGDKNLGATNLYYLILNKTKDKRKSFIYFLLSGFLDLLKSFIPTILFGPLAGSFAVIGHCFSIFSIIITRKIPSGVGAASTIGWLLGLGIEEMIKILVVAIPLLIIGILLFYDIFNFERLHAYSIFLFLTTNLLYIFIFNPTIELRVSSILISIISSFARVLRLRIILKNILKSPGGGI